MSGTRVLIKKHPTTGFAVSASGLVSGCCRVGFQVPVSASVADALPVSFRVRASVSGTPPEPHPGSMGRVGKDRWR